MSRVLLVEAHACFREALGSSLGRNTDFRKITHAGSLAEARACLSADGAEGIDAAIIGLTLPDGDGSDLIEEIGSLRGASGAARHVPVMVLTTTEDAEVHEHLRTLGAAAVLSEAVSLEEVLAAARRLGQKRRFSSRKGSVARMVNEVLSRQASARAARNGETFDDALEAVLQTEAGVQLEELRSGRRGDEWAHRWQEDLAPKRAAARKRERRQEEQRASRDADWERFVQTEVLEMELRKDGQLARTLDKMRAATPQALPPVALPPALTRLASEDRRQAEEGMVSLMSGGKVSYKRLDALTQEDGPARVAANRARTTWLKERRDGWIGTKEDIPVG